MKRFRSFGKYVFLLITRTLWEIVYTEDTGISTCPNNQDPLKGVCRFFSDLLTLRNGPP